MGSMDNTYIYKDKPVFGLDIGFSSIKVLQLQMQKNGKAKVLGYGACNYKPDAVKEGVITDPEALAKSVKKLFEESLVGNISTRRVCIAVPAAKTFTRTMTLPNVKEEDFSDAVRLEAEQYIPAALDDLYIRTQFLPSYLAWRLLLSSPPLAQLPDFLFRLSAAMCLRF
jgi:Tfp pilus assembly PilM family ATPase